MLRKSLVFTFIIFFFLMVFQFCVNFLKTEHSTNYVLTSGEEKYFISETYKKTSDVDYYYFDLLYNDVHYLFEDNNVFNKQKKIVKDVKTYEVNDLVCATLIYVNNEKSDLLCSKNNQLYSYVAFNLNDYDFSKIASDRLISNSSEPFKSEGVVLYSEYLYDDESFILFDYNRILKYTPNGFLDDVVFSNKEELNVNYGALINDFYTIPKISLSKEIYTYYVFNVTMGSIYEITSSIALSKNLVNLGVYDDILYVLDKDNLREFAVDIYKREISEVGNKESDGLIYKNGEMKKISVEEILNSNLTFDFSNELYKEIDCEQIFTFDKYAIYVKDNVFYKVYPNNFDNPIYLFSMNNVKSIRVKNERIYFVVGDILYRFDDNGIYSLIQKGSFKDISINSYDVYISK